MISDIVNTSLSQLKSINFRNFECKQSFYSTKDYKCVNIKRLTFHLQLDGERLVSFVLF